VLSRVGGYRGEYRWSFHERGTACPLKLELYMGLMKTTRNWCGWGICAAALCCCVTVRNASAKTRTATQRSAVLTPWERAEQGREKLEAIAEGSRTKADYTEAMDGFRAVYHAAPGDAHAPDSVNAVAELLGEQGRVQHDAKLMKDAVGQYEFLRTQYPGSSLRVGALLAEGQIYENDLHDASAAREKYALLVKKYPKSELVEEAQAGLASLDDKEQHKELRAQRSGKGRLPGERAPKKDATASSVRSSGAENQVGGGSSFAPMPLTQAADAPKVRGDAQAVSAGDAHRGTAVPVDVDDEAPGGAVAESAGPMHVAKTGSKRRGKLAMVTGIRHWSTPNYTRVAIDLGDDVTYEAARVPNPDRIYFDLHGTRLAQELVGKSFAVTDDGFLKKIRAAQFSDDMTRVVLDVSDVTEYSAFLLPNPYRLIIDIHGGSKEPVTQVAIGGDESAAPAPKAAVVTQPTVMRPVPNTVTVRNASSAEVAELSAQPGRVEATSRPTSQPISAVVRDSDASGQPAGDNSGGSSSASSGKRSRRSREVVGAVPARAAVPTADGETSLVRALGLKIGRIVIDAGHGGHDSGTLGVGGIEEKDVVLDVALRLGKLLHDRLGAEIIYTRSDDTFIPLETRTAIANKAQADLFISIHANSSSDEDARGVETYYLNFTTEPDALDVAARENAVSDQSIHQLSDLVKKITLKDKIAESREFASDVQESLYSGLRKGNSGLKDRGVKKAPFVVLIGANMPSILTEISFVTNAKDASELEQPEYRERVAESLYRGVAKYESGLSGVKAPVERASAR
jgi:N-acetylmuramoyl-L-alanine amidase